MIPEIKKPCQEAGVTGAIVTIRTGTRPVEEGRRRDLESLNLTINETKAMERHGKPRFMPDGSIVYPKRGDPPPDINGYDRDPQDKWRFLPRWLACKTRLQGTVTKPCGALQIIMQCNNSECNLYRQSLNADQCSVCTLRK